MGFIIHNMKSKNKENWQALPQFSQPTGWWAARQINSVQALFFDLATNAGQRKESAVPLRSVRRTPSVS